MDEIEDIKHKIDLVEFVSSYLTVKKAGANYRALCPFHSEKTPSMMISPEKQIFKCFGCFAKGTEVVTESGLKPVEEIMKGELVQTHQGRPKRVLTTFKRRYKGKIIELKTRQTSESIRLTPDHKVFIIKTQNCKQKARQTRLCQSHCHQNCPTKYFESYKIEKLPISEAAIGDYLVYPINKTENDIETIELYDRALYLEKRHQVKTGFAAHGIPEEIPINQDFLKFIGYWIAEGSTYSRGVRFSLGGHEKDFALEIAELAKRVFGLYAGIHYRSGKKTGIEISISNIHLTEIMTRFCGKGAGNKMIPSFCINLPKEKQEILINAIHRGDGTIAKKYRKSRAGRKSITTISGQLSFQVKNLLLRIGYVPVITLSAEHTDKRGVRHRSAWTVSWMPNLINNYTGFLSVNKNLTYWLLPIKEIKKNDFYGTVYNLMVEDDSSYVVKNFAVGNCGEGGDIFTFVMKMENLEFREALEMLAERAGVKLEKYRQNPKFQEEKDQKTRLFQINGWAARFFQKILLDHPAGKTALNYLLNRGLTLETIKDFTLGYAPSSQALKEFLRRKGFTEQEVHAAGGPDRFYKRIIFPIRDVMGNTIGFTGRVLDAEVQPKYLNTPETIIFHKGRILYNLDKARGEIKLAKTTVVVEGQMDVISSYQAGVKNVVATSGTALTDEHLKILYRYTPNIVFSFDSDNAGLATAKKAYEMAIIEGLNAKMVNLGEFKDPGEMAASDEKLWQKAVIEAQPVIDWYFRLAFKGKESEISPQEKKEIAKELIPIIKKIPDQIERAHYVGILAKRLNINEQTVFDVLDKAAGSPPSTTNSATKSIIDNAKNPVNLSNEETFVGLLIISPESIEEIQAKIKPEDLLEEWPAKLYTEILNWYNKNKSVELKDFKKELSAQDAQKLDLILLDIEENYPDPSPAIIDICAWLIEQKREKVKQHYASAIAEAEEKGDRVKLKELVKEFQNAITK